jgi:phage RecT family recombinase
MSAPFDLEDTPMNTSSSGNQKCGVTAGPREPSPGSLIPFLDELEPKLAALLPADITPMRFVQAAKLAAAMQPRLQLCDRRSLSIAFMQAARDQLLPDGHESLIMVYSRKGNAPPQASYQRMVGGWMKLLSLCPGVDGVDAQCVHEADEIVVAFDPKQAIDHRVNAKRDRGPIVSFWAQARLATGFYVKELLSDAQLETIRQHSPAPDSPAWRDWRDQMGLKSVLKRLAKRLPRWREPAAPLPLPSRTQGDRVESVNPEALFALESDTLLAIDESEDAESLQATWMQVVGEFANRGVEPTPALRARHQSRALELQPGSGASERASDSTGLSP